MIKESNLKEVKKKTIPGVWIFKVRKIKMYSSYVYACVCMCV